VNILFTAIAFLWVFGAFPILVWGNKWRERRGKTLPDDIVLTLIFLVYLGVGYFMLKGMGATM
jgi:hypothetical protein